jgi:predicted LPLAT superfamily acyltransferase
MPGWSGKSKGGTFGYLFFIGLLRHTSIRFAYFFVRIIALYYFLFLNRNAMFFYFRRIHRYGRWKSIRSIYRNYCLLGEVLVDKMAFLSGIKSGYTFDFEGEDNLHVMSEGGKGGVLIGAHMGNWEIAGKLLDRIHTRVHILMFEAERENIKQTLERVMVNRPLNVITISDDYSHLFRIEEALKNNEFVVIHGDRYLPGTMTVSVPFMGKPARFPSGPLYLASKKGVPVSFVFTLKEKHTHYHFYASPGRIFPYPSKIKSRREDIREMVLSYVSALEGIVQKYPLQWFNYHHFWEEESASA